MPKLRKNTRKLVCENSVFNIFFERVKSDNGKIIPNYLIISPKQKTSDLVAGISVLPVVNGKYALLRVYRHPIRGDSWEVPRGFLDKGEDSASSAVRELEEETGLICKKSDVCSLGVITPEAGIFEARSHLFVAKNCKPARSFSINELGHLEMKLLTHKEMLRMIKRGAIQDPSTLICFYRYAEIFK